MFSFPYVTINFLLLLLLLLLISTSSSATSISSSNTTSIYEVLSENGLPMGLFPKGVKEFAVGNDGNFWVHLDEACNAKFENELHYDRNVSGHLSFGMIDALTGLEAQDLFLWLRVESIRVDVPSTGMIYFNVGAANKSFRLSLFETPPDCVAVRSPPQMQGQSGRLRYKLDQATSGRDVL
ncbi:hypothetical protein RJT34_16078 [Clitoria ternatea]|uniref:Uncharacterized protein n=1 Tax=Clitoria ternatea TaxID=43366 RepID=A0AAN9J6J2_CLITE